MAKGDQHLLFPLSQPSLGTIRVMSLPDVPRSLKLARMPLRSSSRGDNAEFRRDRDVLLALRCLSSAIFAAAPAALGLYIKKFAGVVVWSLPFVLASHSGIQSNAFCRRATRTTWMVL